MNKFYSIKQVADILKVSSGTIRHWEKEFDGYINVLRDDLGSRMYSEEDIQKFIKIGNLRDQGFSLTSIKEIMANQNEEDSQVETALIALQESTSELSPQGVLQIILDEFRTLREEVAATREENVRLSQRIQEMQSTQLGQIREAIQESQEQLLIEITKSRNETHKRKRFLGLF